MYLKIIHISGIALLGMAIGGAIVYFLMSRKIGRLKEEMTGYKRSLQGFWEQNDKQRSDALIKKRNNLREDKKEIAFVPDIVFNQK